MVDTELERQTVKAFERLLRERPLRIYAAFMGMLYEHEEICLRVAENTGLLSLPSIVLTKNICVAAVRKNARDNWDYVPLHIRDGAKTPEEFLAMCAAQDETENAPKS